MFSVIKNKKIRKKNFTKIEKRQRSGKLSKKGRGLSFTQIHKNTLQIHARYGRIVPILSGFLSIICADNG